MSAAELDKLLRAMLESTICLFAVAACSLGRIVVTLDEASVPTMKLRVGGQGFEIGLRPTLL